MITEFMGGLILLGAILIFLARWRMNRSEIKRGEMELSTARLKQELERTGGEIIERIVNHVNRLEDLGYEAEEKTREMQGQMTELARLQHTIQQQLGSEQSLLKDLDVRLSELRQRQSEIAELHREQQALLTALKQREKEPSPTVYSQGYPQETLAFPDNMQRVDAQDFAALLQKSIERDGGMETSVDSPPPPSLPSSPAATPPDNARGAAANKARSLLIGGWSVEDVAKETGLGRGAVELLKQMTDHQVN